MSRGVHLLDLFSFLTSRRIQAIAALYDAGSQQPVEQLISIVARSHATLCTITTGRQIPYAMNGITLYGSQGRLILSEPFSVNGTGEVRLQSAHQELHKKFTKPVSLYQREIDDFTAAIIEKKKWLGADIHDGVEAVALVTALMAAARHGYDV
jgi:predicted dehydrogenase